MGSREDDAYWDDKYAEASCHLHDEDEMYYDPESGEWHCMICHEDDELERIYKYG